MKAVELLNERIQDNFNLLSQLGETRRYLLTRLDETDTQTDALHTDNAELSEAIRKLLQKPEEDLILANQPVPVAPAAS